MTSNPTLDGRGRCQKCGREFLTLPKDLIDHYVDRYAGWANGECGGKVVPEAASIGGESVPRTEDGK